jgi:murein tripeptide amidase MpaA
MNKTGVDFFMDIHGDEELPYVFLGGPLEVPSATEEMRTNFRTFQATLQIANPDYKRGYEYPGGAPPNPDLRMAWNYIGETFRCLSILVEQPFKDCEHALVLNKGWSPERSKKLGASSLIALNSVIDQLR